MKKSHGVMDADGTAARLWREPPALTLDSRGNIIDCSTRAEEFFGYTRTELAARHVSNVLPQLSDLELLKGSEPNARLNFLCHIGYPFEVRPGAGVSFLCGMSLVCLTAAGQTLLRLIAQTSHGATA